MLSAWQAIATIWSVPLLFPGPGAVLAELLRMMPDGRFLLHLVASLQRLAVGLVVGIPVGILLGCAMGASRSFDAACGPYVRFFNSIPAIALIPFCLLWFGVTELARYSLLVYIVALTVLLYARHGVHQVPGIRVKAAASLGLGPVARFFRVIVPSAFPAILAGIRTALSLAVMVIVAAEMLGATSGLGFLIMQGRQHFEAATMFVGILSLGCLSLLLNRAFDTLIERLLPRWSVKRRIG